MTLSDDSVSRENLLFYLDRMEAPDDEPDGTVYSHATINCPLNSCLQKTLRALTPASAPRTDRGTNIDSVFFTQGPSKPIPDFFFNNELNRSESCHASPRREVHRLMSRMEYPHKVEKINNDVGYAVAQSRAEVGELHDRDSVVEPVCFVVTHTVPCFACWTFWCPSRKCGSSCVTGLNPLLRTPLMFLPLTLGVAVGGSLSLTVNSRTVIGGVVCR